MWSSPFVRLGLVLLAGRTLSGCPEASAAGGAPAPAYAEAVRAVFDTPDAGLSLLTALHEQYPEDDDVAWWLAELSLRAGQATAAAALLEGKQGRRIPPWQFAYSRARALQVTDPILARAEVEWAVRTGGGEAGPEPRALAARLAWDAGDDGAALAHLAAAPAASGELRVWPVVERLPAEMIVEEGGRSWRVTRDGLVGPAEGPRAVQAPEVQQSRGDLVDRAGRPCVPGVPRTRIDPAPGGDGWIYAAIDAPEGRGIYTIVGCGAPPRRLVVAEDAGSPVWVAAYAGAADPPVVWISDGRLKGCGRCAEVFGEGILRLSVGSPGILAVVWHGETPKLRYAPSLQGPLVSLFREDPPVTRATWTTALPGG